MLETDFPTFLELFTQVVLVRSLRSWRFLRCFFFCGSQSRAEAEPRSKQNRVAESLLYEPQKKKHILKTASYSFSHA